MIERSEYINWRKFIAKNQYQASNFYDVSIMLYNAFLIVLGLFLVVDINFFYFLFVFCGGGILSMIYSFYVSEKSHSYSLSMYDGEYLEDGNKKIKYLKKMEKENSKILKLRLFVLLTTISVSVMFIFMIN